MSVWVFSLLIATSFCVSGTAHAQVVFGEQEYDYRPSDVLPGATEFIRKDTFWEGYGPGTEGPRTPIA